MRRAMPYSPEQFEEQDNGIWRAEATDEAAHAWVEIFVEDYGWVPVEVTPLAGDTPQVSYPGFDASILQNLSDVSVTLPDAAAQEDTSSESGQTSERGERAQMSFSWGAVRKSALGRRGSDPAAPAADSAVSGRPENSDTEKTQKEKLCADFLPVL